MSRGPSASTPAPADPAQYAAAEACVRQTRRAFRRLYLPLWRAGEAVMASPSGRAPYWTSRLPGLVERRLVDLRRDCVELPTPATRLMRVVRDNGKELTLPRMRRVLGAYAAWERGRDYDGQAASLLADHDRCRPRRGLVTAEYRPYWAWTGSGKRHWVQITFTNRTPHSIWGSMSGRVWVTGLPPRLRTHGVPELRDPELQAWSLPWGGSSADGWGVAARSTESLIAPVYSDDQSVSSSFPTGPDGAIVRVTMSAGAFYGRHGRVPCPVIVAPR